MRVNNLHFDELSPLGFAGLASYSFFRFDPDELFRIDERSGLIERTVKFPQTVSGYIDLRVEVTDSNLRHKVTCEVKVSGLIFRLHFPDTLPHTHTHTDVFVLFCTILRYSPFVLF